MYKGKAQKGAGGASRAMTHERCRRMTELQKVLGYMPFPGSLNMTLDKPFDFSRPHLSAPILEKPKPGVWDTEWKPKTFNFWPITINGVDCHAVMVEGWKRPACFLEVYAPARLRDFGDEFDIVHKED